MVEYLLVDGYNIIFAWDELKALVSESLEDARVRLLEIMSNYGGTTGAKIIVVFDAHKVSGGLGAVERWNNIDVVYTKEAETADNYIERTTNILAKKYRVRVATSDNLEQIIIMGRGALRVSANELFNEVNLSNKKLRERYIDNKPIKKNMLADNLDRKTASILEDMRRQKGSY